MRRYPIQVIVLCLSVVLMGVGGATAIGADAGAGYLAYKAYNNDLDADSALTGVSAIGGGAAAAGTGFTLAGVAEGATGAAAVGAAAGTSALMIGGATLAL